MFRLFGINNMSKMFQVFFIMRKIFSSYSQQLIISRSLQSNVNC